MAVTGRRLDEMTAVLQAASMLLDYPPVDPDALQVVREAVLDLPASPAARSLRRFLAWWERLDLRQRKMTYVETFDLTTKHCLYLTAAGYRDKRQRGRELLALKAVYRECGLAPATDELPDYLPMLLEFAAMEPRGRDELRRRRATLEALQRSLECSRSNFSHVVKSVLAAIDHAQGTEKAA